jgi:hypothetical protein
LITTQFDRRLFTTLQSGTMHLTDGGAGERLLIKVAETGAGAERPRKYRLKIGVRHG